MRVGGGAGVCLCIGGGRGGGGRDALQVCVLVVEGHCQVDALWREAMTLRQYLTCLPLAQPLQVHTAVLASYPAMPLPSLYDTASEALLWATEERQAKRRRLQQQQQCGRLAVAGSCRNSGGHDGVLAVAGTSRHSGHEPWWCVGCSRH